MGAVPTRNDVVDLAQRRVPMPAPSPLQTCFVRYGGMSQNLATSWEARCSAAYSSVPHLPTAVRWSIAEAPAEWCLPLRTDKYIKPGFKVRAEVVHSQAISVPLQAQVCLLSEQEAADISSWDPTQAFKDIPATPSGPSTVQSSTGAVMKGTLSQGHVLESQHAGLPLPPPDALAATWSPAAAPAPAPSQHTNTTPGTKQNSANSAPTVGPATSSQQLPAMPGGTGPSGVSLQQLQVQRLRQLSQGLGLPMNSALLQKELPQGQAMLAGQPMAAELLAKAVGGLSESVDGSEGGSAAPAQGPQQPATSGMSAGSGSATSTTSAAISNSGSVVSMAQAAASSQPPPVWFPWTVSGPTPMEIPPGSGVSFHDFQFTDLRFAKPSRMSPVYIVFCCMLPLTGDVLISMYSVPTISTCRAEQWKPAVAKLSMTTEPDLNPTSGGGQTPTPAQAAARGAGLPQALAGLPGSMEMGSLMAGLDSNAAWMQGRGSTHSMQMDGAQPRVSGMGHSQGYSQQQQQQQPWPGVMPQPGPGAMGYPMQGASGPFQAGPLPGHEASVPGLVDWIVEEYTGTGLSRRLDPADLQALVALAGLGDQRAVALMPQQQLHTQLAQFARQFRAMLSLLRQISVLWNATAPCIVAGFEVGRDAAARALAAEPQGTFLCRLSMSAAAGGLALAVRATPAHPQAGPDGVLHVLITEVDLSSRRADTLIRDYAGATHLLDVYTGKRVDKRKIFATNYTHVRKLEDVGPPPPLPTGADASQAGFGMGQLGAGTTQGYGMPRQLLPGMQQQGLMGAAGGLAAGLQDLDAMAHVGMQEQGVAQGAAPGVGDTANLLDSLPLLSAPGAAIADPWTGMASISDILLNTDEQAMVNELIDGPL